MSTNPVTFKPAQPFKLQVKSTSDLLTAHAHILLFGKTKAGKTTTSVTLEKDKARNAIVSTQPEEQLAHLRKHGIPYVAVTSATQLEEALRDPRKLFPNMSTLIIDDFTEAVEFKRQNFSEQIKDGRQVYRAINEWSGSVLRRLLNEDYNLIVTAFERGLSDETSTLQWIGPDLPPSAADTVMSKFDFILYLGNDYKLQTQRDNVKRILAGNRMPVDSKIKLDNPHSPDLAKLWDTFTKALQEG